MRFTLHHARHSTSSSPTGLKDYDIENFAKPSCHVPSSMSTSNARRQKMERLRKMLGEDVPVHLVFPDQEKKIAKDGYWIDSKKSTITQDYEVISSASGEDYDYPRGLSPVAVAGTVVPRSKTKGKITGARDSMGAVTPHKANRQEAQKLRKADPIRHSMKSNSSSSPPPPPPPQPSKPTIIKVPATLSSPEKDASQKRLGVIVESPEEHGSSALEGFGLAGCTTGTKIGTTTMTTRKTNVMVHSSYPVDDFLTGHCGRNSRINEEEEEEASMNKLWSTRRGYTGWDRSAVLGRNSESSLSSSLHERKRSMGYRRLPIVDF
ncbi:hypothetical protein Agabi119p4_10797 [Agaricus bisporus var. burnettii]|uniref:Uncharacterized protein n=1 Tax=Agaricus bisporus var. burnettii TaxID=192524 RepID=A0A8H7EVI7_AGABI|nr:hypothetical protein Agabi119p4_10797 [Agaricus bisporus var. burnettii]